MVPRGMSDPVIEALSCKRVPGRKDLSVIIDIDSFLASLSQFVAKEVCDDMLNVRSGVGAEVGRAVGADVVQFPGRDLLRVKPENEDKQPGKHLMDGLDSKLRVTVVGKLQKACGIESWKAFVLSDKIDSLVS